MVLTMIAVIAVIILVVVAVIFVIVAVLPVPVAVPLVELDVAAGELARGHVAEPRGVREPDGEAVVLAWLPVVSDVDLVSEARLTVHLCRAADATGPGVDLDVGRDPGTLHFHARGVIDVGQVAAGGAVPDPTGHAEVR